MLSQAIESYKAEGKSADAAIEEFKKLEPGSISIHSTGGPFLAKGDACNPCQHCCYLVRQFELDDRVFQKGVEPRQARDTRGFFGRLFGRG